MVYDLAIKGVVSVGYDLEYKEGWGDINWVYVGY
jgi:hypothetical protein